MANTMLNQDTIHYLLRTIRSLTFEFKLNHTILYDVIAECKFGENIFGNGFGDKDFNKEQDNDNISDRVKRIMYDRVMLNPEKIKTTNPDPYSKSKVYDDIMQGFQRDLYNNIIILLGFPKITDWYTVEFWEMIGKIDDSVKPDNTALSIIAPNAFVGERKELNFLELIFLSAITLSNKRAEKVKHKGEAGFEAYALRQFKNIKKALFSRQLYEALVMTFMDSLYQEIVKTYDEVRIPYIKEYLLPPKYKNRKDVERALKTHLKRVDEWKEERNFGNMSEEEKEQYENHLVNIYDLEIAVPLAELLLFGSQMKKNADGFYVFGSYQVATIFKKQKKDVKDIMIYPVIYDMANQIADIAKTYINNAIFYAGEMLSSLEEASIVTTPSICEFFEIL